MEAGGTMVAFEVAGGKAAAFRVANALSIIGISNNLGDAKSLITHPETTTHQRLKPEQRAALGIGPGLLRLSVGLEDADDLIEDLAQALDKAARAAPPRRRVTAQGTVALGAVGDPPRKGGISRGLLNNKKWLRHHPRRFPPAPFRPSRMIINNKK